MLFSLKMIFIFSALIFISGLLGLYFIKRSIFFVIIAVETLFLAINMNFLFFSIYINSIQGLVFVFYIIVVSAAEMTILITYFVLYLKKIKLFDSTESYKNTKY